MKAVLLMAGVAIVQLTACSKTVQWEEEVPLNTGAVIWVSRTVEYSLQGAAGNPLDIAYRPDPIETIEFSWAGRKFFHKSDARVMVLAISPKGTPVLLARASDGSWDWKNNYLCAKPHYVQFIPDQGGARWSWPSKIESWTYDLPQNLMQTRHRHEEMLKRYTAQQRTSEDMTGSIQAPSGARIDPTYVGENCKRRG